MPFQEIIHQDHIITIVYVPPRWQASIFPRRADMPGLPRSAQLVSIPRSTGWSPWQNRKLKNWQADCPR